MEVSLKGRQWVYDRALRDLERTVRKAEKRADDARKNLKRYETRIKTTREGYNYECAINSEAKISVEDMNRQNAIWRENLDRKQREVESSNELYRAMVVQKRILADSKVFIVGPATIDSLMHWAPRDSENEEEDPRYDYVSQGRMPFDSIFFEFFDPVKFTVPFVQGEREVLGMTLTNVQAEGLQIKDDTVGLKYALSLFYERGNNIEPGLHVAMNPHQQNIFVGSSEKTRFRIDMREKVVEFDESYDGIRKHYPSKRQLGNDEEAKPFESIANLATNLVNYINGHNVEVRQVGHVKFNRPAGASPPAKGFQVNKPFYMVEIVDDVEERPRNPGDSYTINYQYWVRSHNRRIYNDDRTVRRVRWIKYHKRGPDGAPWKEHRWAVSRYKIEREEEMMKSL